MKQRHVQCIVPCLARLRTFGSAPCYENENTLVKCNAAKLSGSRETPTEKHRCKLVLPLTFYMHKTYTTRRLPKLFFEAFPHCHPTRNQPTCEWLGRMIVLCTHRPCVMCVDARRYGCTAEMLAYTTHEQRYLGSNPRAWLEGGLHHKSNLCLTLLPTPSNQNCLLSTMYDVCILCVHTPSRLHQSANLKLLLNPIANSNLPIAATVQPQQV